MKFRPYPNYKPSEVEWLGNVPEKWEVARIGRFFLERREKVSDTEYPALSVTKNGIVPQLETAAKTDDGDNRKLVCPGDFVINSRSDRKGSSGMSLLSGSVSLISIVMQPQDFNIRFAHHLFRSYPFQEEFYRYGKGIVADLWSTNFSEMRNINIPIPTKVEQETIAYFLDRETAKIDILIAKQERLIALLKEKRQAVISHAVTKGLDPTVPMKPSGVEWLGDVPEHWEIKRVKHFGKVIGGFAFKSTDFCEQGQPVIKISNVSHMTFDWSDESFLPAEFLERHEEYVAPTGSILFAMTRPLISGGIKVAHLDSDERYLVNQRVGFIPGLSEVNALFILFSTQSSPFIAQFENNTTMTNQPNISSEGIESITIPSPPNGERTKIVEFLQDQTKRIDILIAKAEQAITLQKEHRTALISSAITGKIDVREVASDLQKAA